MRFIELIVVTERIEVDGCMDEAEDETFSGPVDDDVNRHIIVVYCNFFSI